jgi:hypothetical protein
MKMVIAALVLGGYVLALVPARLCYRDIGSFRRTLWVGVGNRHRWLRGVLVAYLAFGWPSFVVFLTWRTGQTRRALVELRGDMRQQRLPSGAGVADHGVVPESSDDS